MEVFPQYQEKNDSDDLTHIPHAAKGRIIFNKENQIVPNKGIS